MKFSDHIQTVVTPGRIVCGALLLACLSLPATGSARQTAAVAPAAAPAAPQAPPATAPATTPAPRPAQATTPRRPPVSVTPRVPRMAPAPASAPTAPAQAATPRAAAAPIPPREVVTVVHRLSGWKLLAWLATSGPPALELDELPSMTDSHTNIVAGYIYEDGRTVVARLSQAEADLESFALPLTPPGFFAPTGGAPDTEPEYLLVTADNKRVEAKF